MEETIWLRQGERAFEINVADSDLIKRLRKEGFEELEVGVDLAADNSGGRTELMIVEATPETTRIYLEGLRVEELLATQVARELGFTTDYTTPVGEMIDAIIAKIFDSADSSEESAVDHTAADGEVGSSESDSKVINFAERMAEARAAKKATPQTPEGGATESGS